jgi:hypothetical protein
MQSDESESDEDLDEPERMVTEPEDLEADPAKFEPYEEEEEKVEARDSIPELLSKNEIDDLNIGDIYVTRTSPR